MSKGVAMHKDTAKLLKELIEIETCEKCPVVYNCDNIDGKCYKKTVAVIKGLSIPPTKGRRKQQQK